MDNLDLLTRSVEIKKQEKFHRSFSRNKRKISSLILCHIILSHRMGILLSDLFHLFIIHKQHQVRLTSPRQDGLF